MYTFNPLSLLVFGASMTLTLAEPPSDLCQLVVCPEGSHVAFYSETKECVCEAKYVASVLIHQTTGDETQQIANVYGARPFLDQGVIEFLVQLDGMPDGFRLNASTTIAVNQISDHPQPNLFLVPKTVKSPISETVRETALIIGVTFGNDGLIFYYTQLDNGTLLKLSSDKHVHNINLMDPNSPPDLSIVTREHFDSRQSHAVDHLGLRRAPIHGRRDEMEFSIRSVLPTDGSSSETCRHILHCQEDSKPRFDETTRQCLCVMYRPGVVLPIITSDSTVIRRE